MNYKVVAALFRVLLFVVCIALLSNNSLRYADILPLLSGKYHGVMIKNGVLCFILLVV